MGLCETVADVRDILGSSGDGHGRRTGGIIAALASIIGVCLPAMVATADTIVERDIEYVRENLAIGSVPMSKTDFARLRRLGFTRIIDMRSFNPGGSWLESQRAARAGIEYIHEPLGFRPLYRNSLPKIFRLIECGQKVYIHCQLGRDRVGLIAALYRVRDGRQTADQSYRQWKEDQFNPLLGGLNKAYRETVERWRQSCDAR